MPPTRLACLFAAILAARLCHIRVVWVEEAYPIAAALRMLDGAVLYRDVWFDKPPLFPALYLLWGAQTGWPLRLAGAVFVTLCCWLGFRLARLLWSEREGWAAALLLAFSLTFWIPSAVMALAPDLLLLAPHLLALSLAARGRALSAGAAAGAALLLNSKALFLLPVLLFWTTRRGRALAGFLLAAAAGVACLVALGAGLAYWEQVWDWGFAYSASGFADSPLREGFRRTLNWAGFHAALLVAAAVFWCREPDRGSRLRLAVWVAISLVAVCAGWRFFPRYYFHVLPAVALPAARGLCLVRPRAALAIGLLLLIPLGRFGPRYVQLAAGSDPEWSDLALYRDSHAVAAWLRQRAHPQDTLLVWGYRPDIFALTRLRAGTPFLDSQPLTGVLADRHLTRSHPTYPELAARQRQRLRGLQPDWIVDGLGPLNPQLSVQAYADLSEWLAHYEAVGRTTHAVIYRRILNRSRWLRAVSDHRILEKSLSLGTITTIGGSK